VRFDEVGLFWNDSKPIKTRKEKIVRTPPDPVWLSPDYLPFYDEAKDWEPECMTNEELVDAKNRGDRLVWDTESYPNYWSAGFTNVRTGRCLIFENSPEFGLDFDKSKLDWVLRNFTLVDFNGESYDRHTAAIAIKPGTDASHMYQATQQIIEFGTPGWMVVQNFKARKIKMDHIDLIQLTPLAPSLKIMAGRLASSLMMDLPFKPGTYLTWEQMRIIRWYMFNDNRNTQLVYEAQFENIKLREEFGPKYGVDLRSKSDAQIAEAIFRAEVRKRTGRNPEPIPFTGSFKFKMPDWVQFKTPELQWLRQQLIDADFVVGDNGYVQEPAFCKDLQVPIGGMKYTFGIGGLHSTEKSIAHCIYNAAGERKFILRDHDVASYYPWLILNSGYYPPAIGPAFIPIFQEIFDRRQKEKKIDKKGVWALGLKIVLNGTFGKTSDPYSVMYYPPLMVQTTISGQLALFMMIERAYLAGMEVTSANTDGVIIKCPVERDADLKAIVKDWKRRPVWKWSLTTMWLLSAGTSIAILRSTRSIRRSARVGTRRMVAMVALITSKSRKTRLPKSSVMPSKRSLQEARLLVKVLETVMISTSSSPSNRLRAAAFLLSRVRHRSISEKPSASMPAPVQKAKSLQSRKDTLSVALRDAARLCAMMDNSPLM